MVSLNIRRFVAADIPMIVPVFMRGFHYKMNHERLLHWLLKLQPDGFWNATMNGDVAGMVGAVRYGPAAYVSMMVVDPALQRRGIGHALMKALLADLDRHDCTTVMLESTEEGMPLYRSFGFEVQGTTHDVRRKCERDLVPAAAEPLPPRFDEIVALDAEAFGAPRRQMLQQLLALPNSRARHMDGGCIVANEYVVGPWVARSPEIAETLLDQALQLTSTKAGRLMVPSENESALDMLEQRGYEIVHTSPHMSRGPELPNRNRSLTYGQASFALG